MKITLLLFSFFVGFSLPLSTQAADTFLFSEEDALKLNHSAQEWQEVTRQSEEMVAKGLFGSSCQRNEDGPTVDIIVPEIEAYELTLVNPTALIIRFSDNDSTVDMSSLEVTGRKGIFFKDLTGDMRPHIKEQTLQVNNITIPCGNFLMDLSIADNNGNINCIQYQLVVKSAEE